MVAEVTGLVVGLGSDLLRAACAEGGHLVVALGEALCALHLSHLSTDVTWLRT